MTEHLPECPMLEPCSAATQHCYCSRQNTCIHDEMECICERLRACEERVAREELARSDQGSGGFAPVLCHKCQQPVRFTAIAIEHADGAALCLEQRTFKHDIINAPEGGK